ncbi:MAG: glycosyltransferase [Candidatus Omnitrophica bacterium]|nr:glycosyltransferase [Candidatus Omnitrophota bacterium]
MQILPRMNIGGIERGVLDLVKFFAGSSHKENCGESISNIVVSGGGNLIGELEKEGIKHYQLPVYKKSPSLLLLVPKLKKIIAAEGIDIVHARSRMPAIAGFFASRNSKAQFITTAHGVYKSKVFSEVMAWGKYVICPSKVVARHMKNAFGVPEEKIVIVNRWVDLSRFTFTDYSRKKENNIIVSMGRISPSKGYEHLIRAFKKIVRFNPYLKLRIVGSASKSKGRYLEYLKSLVFRFSLNYNVEFSGFHYDVEKFLDDARILVAPSVIEESFGRVVIEAFASGVPVIASNIGGFKEIIEPGVDGLLVEPGNSDEISEAILKLIQNPDMAQAMTLKARKKVEARYTMEQCLQETASVYDRAVKDLRILVIKISSLGDLILSFPSLKALRQRYPKAKISLLTLKKYHSLMEECPYVDEIIALTDNYKAVQEIMSLTRRLRRKSFDYIIDLQNNRASHLISFFSFPLCSFGYSLRWGFLLSRRLKFIRNQDPLSSQEKILELLGVRLNEKKLTFWPVKENVSFNLPSGDLIGIAVSASAKWHSKNWPPENIIKLGQIIERQMPSFKIILLGEESSKDLAGKIESCLGPSVVNLCGKTTLRELSSVLGKLKLFIAPDTATLHLACAKGIKTLALFGPTDPRRHTVEDEGLEVLYEKLECSFCYRGQCRLGKDSLCLEKISPQKVFSKIREMIA